MDNLDEDEYIFLTPINPLPTVYQNNMPNDDENASPESVEQMNGVIIDPDNNNNNNNMNEGDNGDDGGNEKKIDNNDG